MVDAVSSRRGSRELCRAFPIIFDNVLAMRRVSCGFAPIFLPPDETSGWTCFAAWRIGRSSWIPSARGVELDHDPESRLSDAADLFVFISGYTAAFVFGPRSCLPHGSIHVTIRRLRAQRHAFPLRVLNVLREQSHPDDRIFNRPQTFVS
jgi:hypothetical protein